MATTLRLALSAAFLLAAAGCASPPVTFSDPADRTATFVVVRHAEKGADDPRDPGLSAAGAERARALAARFADRNVVAVYATAFRRSYDTALPTAQRHGVSVLRYDAATPPDTFADTLRRAHPHGTVLVVGHSNTVPAIVSALCGCAVAPMDDNVYDRIHEVRIDASGTPSMHETRD